MNSDEELEESSGNRLVTLTETTQTFLEATFLGTMPNKDCKQCVEKIVNTQIPKPDGLMKAVLPKDT